VTDRLLTWDRLSNRKWPTLLIGNGLSINIWNGFAYKRLLERANLNYAASQLFSDLNTVNFEVVLEGLWHAERVLDAIGQRSEVVRDLYKHVQDELVAAVHRVHVPWDAVPKSTLAQIASVLDIQNLVFTLNYDLLTYWSLMDNTSPTYMGDYFWAAGSTFDSGDSGLAPGRTGLLYLHGGVHLWQESTTGLTGKWAKGNLLANLASYFHSKPDRQPLVVSEGTSAQKMAVIRRSEYLSFALRLLVGDASNTVIFGANFGSQDTHVVRALAAGRRRKIAISVLPGTSTQNTTAMARYRSKLPEHDLFFFDSRSHPLGDPALTLRQA
jgi:hypothetical protein